MRLIFSTSDVPAAEAFDYWMDVACAAFSNHTAHPNDRDSFFAHLEADELADLTVMNWRVAPEEARHGGVDSNDVLLLLPRHSQQIEFANRSFELNSSGLVLFDTRAASIARAVRPIEALGVRIPRALIGERIPDYERVVNQPVPLERDAAFLASFVRELVRIGPSTLSEQSAAASRNFLLELIVTSFGSPDPAPAPSVFAAGAAGYEFAREVMQAGILDAERIAGQTAQVLAEAKAGHRNPGPSAPPSDRQPRRREDS